MTPGTTKKTSEQTCRKGMRMERLKVMGGMSGEAEEGEMETWM